MQIDFTNFTSLFELFAVFNFAYVLSAGFIEIIQNKITLAYRSIDKRIEEVNSMIQVIENSLTTIANSIKPEENKKLEKKISQARRNLYENEIQYNDLNQHLKGAITNASHSRFFSYICLFQALYCLSVLIYNGVIHFGIFNLIACQETFFFHLLLSGGFICLMLYFDTKYCLHSNFKELLEKNYFLRLLQKCFKPGKTIAQTLQNGTFRDGHFKIIIVFVLIGIASIFYYFTRTIFLDYYIFNPSGVTQKVFIFIVSLLSLVLPSLHFIYYFWVATRTRRKLEKLYFPKIDELKKKINDFNEKEVESLKNVFAFLNEED